MLRRALPITLSLALLCAYIPAPVSALSTSGEVQIGRDTDRQVTEAYTVITDPLENAWVNGISKKLWAQVVRKDVPYNIKILDDSNINAFTTLGGFIYINEGTLDFAQSDDELAGVIGHETGHDERRHAITFQRNAQIANVLLGIGALFSPFIYRFGQIGQAALLAKMSRADEAEADKYGLLLMSRAGYDPAAMVSFMRHLNAAHGGGNSLVDRMFADHPATPDRIKALAGSAEIDPKQRPEASALTAALHNVETGRYNIAQLEFTDVLKRDPNNAAALLGLGQMQLALGQNSKGEQTLGQVVGSGTAEAQRIAQIRLTALRESQRKTDLLRVNLAPLREEFAAAQAREAQAATVLTSRRDAGRDQIKSISARVQAISYSLTFNPGQVQARKGSRIEVVQKNFNTIARSLDTALTKTSSTVGGIGSLEKNKDGGMLKDDADIFNEMGEPLKLAQPPPQSVALFSSYPKMFADMAATDSDLIRAADAARGALALLDVGLGAVDTFFKQLTTRAQLDQLGDVNSTDFKALEPLMASAVDSMSKAAVAASQAEQLFDMARARQLQTRVTLLGVGFPSERYDSLQRALEYRFPGQTLSYDQMLENGLSAGEVAAASIVAAGTNATPLAIVREAKLTNRSIIDVANSRGMRAKSLEMFMGLVYLAYADDPAKEALGRN